MADQEQSNEWFLARDGQQHGPLSDVEVRKFAELGYLRPDDLVWRQGLQNWVSATSMFGGPTPQPAPSPLPSSAPPRAAAQPAGAPRGNLDQPPGPRPGDPRSPAARTGSDTAGYAGDNRMSPRSPAMASQAYPPGGQPTAPSVSRHAQYPGTDNPLDPRNRIVYADHPPQAATPHASGSQGFQGPGPYGPAQAQPSPDEADERPSRGFPWLRIAVVMVFAVAIGASAAFYFKSAVSFGSLSQIFAGLSSDASTEDTPVVRAPRDDARVVASNVRRDGTDANPIVTASSAPPPAAPSQAVPIALGSTSAEVDAALQKTKLWQVLKKEFADWYNERVQDAVRSKSQRKDDGTISSELSQALVKLRRENADAALSASPARLQAIAATFVDNLDRLAKHSTEACYGYISAGETDPIVSELMRSSELAAPLQAQLAAIFEAIADGRRAPKKHPQVQSADFDALTAHLSQRGWGPQDLQLFSDARALSRATPVRVCKMVRDWFTAQLDVKDEAVQVRLLVETLKPVVSG